MRAGLCVALAGRIYLFEVLRRSSLRGCAVPVAPLQCRPLSGLADRRRELQFEEATAHLQVSGHFADQADQKRGGAVGSISGAGSEGDKQTSGRFERRPSRPFFESVFFCLMLRLSICLVAFNYSAEVYF